LGFALAILRKAFQHLEERPPMKRRVFVTIAALIVAFVMGGAMAYAQRITTTIEFPFVAGGKDMPAGKYTLEVTPSFTVILKGPTDTVLLPVITSLGRHDRDADPEVVFDKVDGKVLLSEIWMPDKDGLLVLATKGPHEHAVLGGSNPRK
jgi:hypothetical protein